MIVHKANFYGYKIPNEYKGPIFELEINESKMEFMKKIGIIKVIEIINKSNGDKTDFENMILSGIHWFADSMIQKQIENQFLSLMICLEIFLTPGGERISNFISDAVARILTFGLENRLELKEDIKDFYTKRSAIVHGSRKKMPITSDVSYLQSIVAELILWMIKNSEYFDKKRDLLDYIEKRQLA